MLKRIHLFEFEDLSWFPGFLRGYLTDLLQFQMNTFKVYDPIIPKIEEALDTANENQIVDLCSGSSGPIINVYNALKNRPDFKIVLTDKYPNLETYQDISDEYRGRIDFVKESVDVVENPVELKGLKTFFSGFHHFKPEDAQKIIENCIRSKESICIFEFTERSLINIVKITFFGFLLVWLNTPFIRPFKLGRLFWTYIIPVVPLTYCWDGFVSHIRSYSQSELARMVDRIEKSDSYYWDIGKVRSKKSGFNITYLVGNSKDV